MVLFLFFEESVWILNEESANEFITTQGWKISVKLIKAESDRYGSN
jgi:hypothetical protein